MDIFRIAIFGITGAILALMLRDGKNTYSMLTAITVCLLIFAFILPYLTEIMEKIKEIGDGLDIYTEYISVMIKALVVAYISMFSSQLCRDFGQGSIGDKIELGGKVIILINAVSIMDDMAERIMRFIQ